MGPEFMAWLMRQADTLAFALKPVLPAEPHLRGKFAQILLGHKHRMGGVGNVSGPPLILSTNAHAPKVSISPC